MQEFLKVKEFVLPQFRYYDTWKKLYKLTPKILLDESKQLKRQP